MHRAFTDVLVQELIVDNKAGASLSALARRHNVSVPTIRNTFRRVGHRAYYRGKAGGPTRSWSDDEIAEIVRRYAAGESQEVIAKALRTSPAKISRLLRTRGGWDGRRSLRKGGIVHLHGYRAQLVYPDDALAAMRNSQGYVLEHRLVMACSLGRPLGKDETVHHLNGDKLDNRLENLQLRQGRHGNGVVHRCLDCGSTNVEPVSLD